MMQSGAAVFLNSYCSGLQPDPVFTVANWADKYRTLSSRSSAEPGPWRTDRAPYLRDIMDDLSVTSPVEEIVVMKGSQLGFTEVGNNWLGYVVHHAPGPFLLVQPTVELAKRNSHQRIEPLINESPILSKLVSQKRSKDSANTVLAKDFKGGLMVMTGANSAVGLRSMPARYLFLDEVDAYPQDVDGEGDPVDLARGRTKTFARRKKIYAPSTPTIEGRSRIAQMYELSDQRKFFIPCPTCDHFQTLEWKNLEWEKGKPETVKYICEECQKEIPEYTKTQFLVRGEWRASKPGAKLGKVRGYHISSLYSPYGWYSWANAAQDWEEAQGKPEKLRTFINTVLAETWKDKGEAPEYARLYERREHYPFGVIPKGGILLVAGVDVQKDRLEMEIVAYGRGRESWSIDYRYFPGDTSNDQAQVWKDLEKVLGETWPLWNGNQIPLRLVTVDSGYNTQVVYSWARRFQMNRVAAIKGSASLQMIFSKPSAVDVNWDGRSLRRALKIYSIGTSVIKNETYGFLRQDKAVDGQDAPAGYCHFPQYSEDYFKQLTSEQLTARIVKGYRKFEWVKVRDRNEALDCRCYARAAAAICGMDRATEKEWVKWENQLGLYKPIARKEVVASKPAVQAKAAKKKPTSSFWGD